MSDRPVASIITTDLFGDEGPKILQYADGSINLLNGAELFPLDDDQIAVLQKMLILRDRERHQRRAADPPGLRLVPRAPGRPG